MYVKEICILKITVAAYIYYQQLATYRKFVYPVFATVSRSWEHVFPHAGRIFVGPSGSLFRQRRGHMEPWLLPVIEM